MSDQIPQAATSDELEQKKPGLQVKTNVKAGSEDDERPPIIVHNG